jgi:solute:Na+ symporter, SSS family
MPALISVLVPRVPVLAVFGPVDWGIVGAYFALVIGVGFWVSRKRGEEEGEVFLAGRSMPTWAVAISLVATMLSAATFVAVPDEAYGGNLTYLILNLGCILAVFVVAVFFVPRLYAAGTVTIYGFLARRFGENARIAVSCAFILGRLLSSGARLFTAAIPLCLLLFGTATPHFGQIALAIALIGVIGTIYATAGGVRAVVWVDTIQFAIVMGTALLTVGMLLHAIPASIPDIYRSLDGSSKLQVLDTSLDPKQAYTLWTALIANTFLMTAALGCDHDLAQRFLITKSAFRGSISMIASQFIGIPVVFLFLLIGLLLYVFYQCPGIMGAGHAAAHPASAKGLAVYPWFLLHEMPTGLAGISIVGFFAIAQGSLDSAMNALAASIVADIYAPLRQRLHPNAPAGGKPSRITVAVVGGGMMALAMFCAAIFDSEDATILKFVLSLMTFALSGMLGVFLTALFTRRGNPASVIAALFTGAAVVTLLHSKVMPLWTNLLFHAPQKIAFPWWMPAGTVAAFLVCVAGKPKSEREAET